MQVLVGENVVIDASDYYNEIDSIRNKIVSKEMSIFSYLSLPIDVGHFIVIKILKDKEELDDQYREVFYNEKEKLQSVPSSIVAFNNDNVLYVLSYEAYQCTLDHERDTVDDYANYVLFHLIPIYQKVAFGRLSNNSVINRGLAAFLTYDDLNTKMLDVNYHELMKSGNPIQCGDFVRFIDDLKGRDYVFKLLRNELEEDEILNLYEGYKKQFFASRSKQW